MPEVWIPALLQPLSAGKQKVSVTGKTIRQVIDNLDQQFPGMRERLLDGDRLRPSIAVVVDGVISQEKLRHKLDNDSEVHFMPAISGGSALTPSHTTHRFQMNAPIGKELKRRSLHLEYRSLCRPGRLSSAHRPDPAWRIE